MNIDLLSYTELPTACRFHYTIFLKKDKKKNSHIQFHQWHCQKKTFKNWTAIPLTRGRYKLSKILIIAWNADCYKLQQIKLIIFLAVSCSFSSSFSPRKIITGYPGLTSYNLLVFPRHETSVSGHIWSTVWVFSISLHTALKRPVIKKIWNFCCSTGYKVKLSIFNWLYMNFYVLMSPRFLPR